MKNRLTGFGWFVIVFVIVIGVAAWQVATKYGWFWGVVTALGGFAVICFGAAFFAPKPSYRRHPQ